MSSVAFHHREKIPRNSNHQKGQDPLRAVTELFLSAAPQFDDDSVAIVDTVFDFALPKPNAATLTDISVRMAPLPNAPSRLMKRLASDAEISVAGPVLSQSPRLSEADLCGIAAVMSNSHLLAISARKQLTSAVTDILIDRGDNQVARKIASNKTAELSDRGVARLLERAESDETISASLCARTDLPPDAIQNGLANAKSRAEDANAKISAAKRFAVLLQQAGDLTEVKINALATERQYEKTLASISLLSRLKYQFIERMMQGPDLRGLTLVCKSLGFNITTMNAIWNLTVSFNGASLDKIRSARRDFLTVSEEIANAVQAAMSSLHSLSAE